MDTRDKISNLKEKIDKLETELAEAIEQEDEDLIESLSIDLAKAKDDLRFAYAEDEEEYNYALKMQEFNLDGGLKYYDN